MIKCQLTSDRQILLVSVAHVIMNNKAFQVPVNQIVLIFKERRAQSSRTTEKELLKSNTEVHPTVQEEDGVPDRATCEKGSRSVTPCDAGVTSVGNCVRRHLWAPWRCFKVSPRAPWILSCSDRQSVEGVRLETDVAIS